MSRTTHRLTTTVIAFALVAALAVMVFLSRRHDRDTGKVDRPTTVASSRSTPPRPETVEVVPATPTEPSTHLPIPPPPAVTDTPPTAPTPEVAIPPAASQQVAIAPSNDGDGIALLPKPAVPPPAPAPPASGAVVAVAADAVTYLAFASDGRLLVAGAGGRIEFVNVTSGQRQLVETKIAMPRAIALSPDGDRIAIASADATVIWHVTSVSATPVAGGDVTALAFAHGGGLVTGHSGGEVKLWETPGWTNVATIAPGVGSVGRVAISPTALQVVAIGASGGVAVCDPGDRQVKQRLAADKPWAWVEFSPDGHTLAAAGPGGVAMWDTVVWQARPAPGANDAATFVSFWRGGAALVIAGADGAIRIFDVATRQSLTTLGGGANAGAIASIALGVDDRTIAISNGTGVVIWDSATRASRQLP